MVKLLLCVLIVVGCGYVGWGFGFHYTRREKFFSELIRFCEFAKSEILFLQLKKQVLFEKFSTSQKDLALILSEAQKEFSECQENERSAKTADFLKPEERLEIENFLRTIGKRDVENECTSIDNFKETVEVWHKRAVEEKAKYAGSGTKLGIAFGLAVSIIIY